MDGGEPSEFDVGRQANSAENSEIRIPWVNFGRKQNICTIAASGPLGHFEMAEKISNIVSPSARTANASLECPRTFVDDLLWSTAVIIIDDLELRHSREARNYIQEIRNFKPLPKPLLLVVGPVPRFWEMETYFSTLDAHQIPDKDWRGAPAFLFKKIYEAYNVRE